MKGNKLLCVAIPIMLLAGCGGVDKASTEKQDKTVETQKSIKKEKVSKEDYPNKINDLCVEFDSKFADFNKTLSDALDGKGGTKKDIVNKLNEANKIIDKFLAIDPPSEYAETQKDVEKAMEHYTKAFKLNNEVFTRTKQGSKTDKELMEEAESELKKGDEYWFKFYKNLEDKIKIGTDGTVTAKTLRELDKKSGIDSEVVRTNLSKEGKELVGKWGLDKSEGFIVSLIMNDDGTYEAYGKGDYPNKDKTYAKGKWTYDSNSQTITLHVEKNLINGEEQKEAKNVDVPYTVQNFDGKNIQLFSPKTFNTIKYVKQK
ncbi:DUF3994 domain-containing protein [Bacillus pseudomycoides]|uniref:DUF3994 domain-containing protein n=1 Tax=Bacillus pseudomycoides TaxID=64104 RepID=UPI0015CF08E7|nr:DUF3994 domain-containing protein [Bacillus pseudomycoides]